MSNFHFLFSFLVLEFLISYNESISLSLSHSLLLFLWTKYKSYGLSSCMQMGNLNSNWELNLHGKAKADPKYIEKTTHQMHNFVLEGPISFLISLSLSLSLWRFLIWYIKLVLWFWLQNYFVDGYCKSIPRRRWRKWRWRRTYHGWLARRGLSKGNMP